MVISGLLGEVKEIKNRDYLEEISKTPCVACYFSRNLSPTPTTPHHESLGVAFNYYKRGNDYGTLPLCPNHHMERHQIGFDHFWEEKTGSVLTPTILSIRFLIKYAADNNIKLSTDVMAETNEEILYGLPEHKLRELFDTIVAHVHFTNETGEDLTPENLERFEHVFSSY